MLKVYVAGSLFNEAEVAQRKAEGVMLRREFPELDIFNPIDQPFNENKQSLPTPEMIYEGDTQAVEACDIFIADLTNEDAGVMVELGIAIKSDTKIIIGINSDIRLQSANCYAVPTMGMNHYVLGAILKHGYFVRSFAEAVEKLKELLKEENQTVSKKIGNPFPCRIKAGLRFPFSSDEQQFCCFFKSLCNYVHRLSGFLHCWLPAGTVSDRGDKSFCIHNKGIGSLFTIPPE